MSHPFRLCLLIEDNCIDNFINSGLIKNHNFASEVVVIEDPQTALSELSDGRIVPDIIFLDIRMPKMTGFQFLNGYDKLDIDKSHTKIYMLSSSVDPADIHQAEDNKYVSGYLIKALTPDKLLKIVG